MFDSWSSLTTTNALTKHYINTSFITNIIQQTIVVVTIQMKVKPTYNMNFGARLKVMFY